jgi:hypothetical protein
MISYKQILLPVEMTTQSEGNKRKNSVGLLKKYQILSLLTLWLWMLKSLDFFSHTNRDNGCTVAFNVLNHKHIVNLKSYKDHSLLDNATIK